MGWEGGRDDELFGRVAPIPAVQRDVDAQGWRGGAPVDREALQGRGVHARWRARQCGEHHEHPRREARCRDHGGCRKLQGCVHTGERTWSTPRAQLHTVACPACPPTLIGAPTAAALSYTTITPTRHHRASCPTHHPRARAPGRRKHPGWCSATTRGSFIPRRASASSWPSFRSTAHPAAPAPTLSRARSQCPHALFPLRSSSLVVAPSLTRPPTPRAHLVAGLCALLLQLLLLRCLLGLVLKRLLRVRAARLLQQRALS